jgi:DNA invertase Pin-like site-specific DNA recombinase
VLAEYERELIARRTKSALQIAKQRGTTLGAPANLTPSARQKGLELRKHNALTKNAQARELARLYREKGMTLAAIATRLNEQGYRTRRGKMFLPASVWYLLRKVTER